MKYIKLFEKFKKFDYYEYLMTNYPEQLEDVESVYIIDSNITEEENKEIYSYLNPIVDDLFPFYKDVVTIIFVVDLETSLGLYRSETESKPIIMIDKGLHNKRPKGVRLDIAYKSTLVHELCHAMIDLLRILNDEYEFPFEDEEVFVEEVAYEYIMNGYVSPELCDMIEECQK